MQKFREAEEELENDAGWVHLTQAGLYWMGYKFHKKRSKKIYQVISLAGVMFHLWSTWKHWHHKQSSQSENQELESYSP